MIDIRNLRVYDLDESLIASGYPMRTDLPKCMPGNVDDADFIRAERLGCGRIGEGHDNFLNGILVSFDLTAPIKMWTELQRYHFMDFVSSASTMHKLTKFNLLREDAFDEYVCTETINNLRVLQKDYNDLVERNSDKAEIKEAYLRLLMNCPVGLNLTARLTTNYRQLKTIYLQRKHHRLPCWRKFCKWVESLPMSQLITGKKADVDAHE